MLVFVNPFVPFVVKIFLSCWMAAQAADGRGPGTPA
jgi:hypothetical protein